MSDLFQNQPIIRPSGSRRSMILTSAASATALIADLSMLPSIASAAPARRMPAIFIGHGSPMNAIQDNDFTRTLNAWGKELPRPAAILSVSAHWLTPGVTGVTAQGMPETIHDFGGFPAALHEMKYPAPGAPTQARLTAQTVKSAKVLETDQWGLDHGT